MTDLDERGVARAIHAASGAVDAPVSLREALDAQRTRRAARGRRASLLGASVTAVGAIAMVVLLLHPGAAQRPPSVADAAAVALLTPTLPAPAPDRHAPLLLRASAGGVRFPDYANGGLAWQPVGVRRARRGGQGLVVVSYRRSSVRVGYAIVEGPALPISRGGRSVAYDGVRFAVIHRAGATIVTWRRGGHTCVLASRDATEQAMLEMASWHPAQTVPA